ncbi:MAG: transcription elongation factor GreA [Clostridia bacterium]|jgi:transcription elongation factor GreA|nr:transcription elongation factor GreA [Clostridia bacterium]
MPEKEVILTPTGLKKLEEELEYLKTVKRREIAERIKQAIEFGDISENSEYEDAKNEQAFVEGRILTLEKKLRYARVLDDSEVDTNVISLGCKVLLKDLETGDELEYVIVGSMEANPGENKISNVSPVGKALMGAKIGDTVEVSVPAGVFKYQVLNISK